ncbi:hypothetical protein D3C73_1597270 [compost metagenome]
MVALLFGTDGDADGGVVGCVDGFDVGCGVGWVVAPLSADSLTSPAFSIVVLCRLLLSNKTTCLSVTIVSPA